MLSLHLYRKHILLRYSPNADTVMALVWQNASNLVLRQNAAVESRLQVGEISWHSLSHLQR